MKEKPEAVIFDIDGTLAEMHNRGPFEWKKVGNDLPHLDIATLLDILRLQDYKIILVSGRDGSCREETEKWLTRYRIFCDELYLRPTGNYEKDFTIKKNIYERYIQPRYNIHYVFDDRDQAVKAWREMGLRCLQVAPGDF